MYGSGILLYIGKADAQTFGTRIPQHDKWIYNQDANNIEVYTGRIASNYEVSDEEWSSMIDIAEKLMIYTHKPAYNSSNINSISTVPIESHVFNWGSFRNLFPEVSGFRYLADDDIHFSDYWTLGEKKKIKKSKGSSLNSRLDPFSQLVDPQSVTHDLTVFKER